MFLLMSSNLFNFEGLLKCEAIKLKKLGYDVWVTRGIIIDFDNHELAFEKPVWFSEDIVIRKGYNLSEKFQPTEEICKAGKWKDGVMMECSREVVIL